MNNAVKEAVENSVSETIADICQNCARSFDTKSKPTKCQHCHRYFHKTSCLSVHSTSCSKNQNLVTGESSSLASNSATPSRSSIPPSQKRKRTDTHCPQPQPPPPPPDPCSTSSPRPAPEQSRASDLRQHHQIISTSQPHPVHPPAIQTALPPPHNSPPPSALPSSLPNNSNSPLNALAVPFNQGFSSNKRKTTKNKSVTPDLAKIDFLNLELDASKTRIVQLETTVEDRDITIRILNDKIKLLEQNQQNFINSRYNK